jgi:undecaprenyl-diphosphatase
MILPKSDPSGSQIRLPQVAFLLLAVVGFYFFLPRLGSLNSTISVLGDSAVIWVLAGIAATGLGVLASAITQYAAGNFSGRLNKLISLQFAGSFVNHFLPFNLGGVAMTAAYYRKLGQRGPQAVVTSTVPIILGVVTSVAIILVISPITLISLNRTYDLDAVSPAVALGVGLGIILALLALLYYQQSLKSLLASTILGLRSIRTVRQLSVLVAGAATITLLAALTLYASVRAVHGHIAITVVILLYITTSVIGNITPTPGGLGTTEAMLIVGFTKVGLSLAQAVSATLIFRFLTFWLPLLPGGLIFMRLRSRNITETH